MRGHTDKKKIQNTKFFPIENAFFMLSGFIYWFLLIRRIISIVLLLLLKNGPTTHEPKMFSGLGTLNKVNVFFFSFLFFYLPLVVFSTAGEKPGRKKKKRELRL